MKTLFLIPARGGSKGIPGKNIKKLNGIPLINYSIAVARELAVDRDICVSSDDMKIINVAEDFGLKVPFVRPQELATDTSGSSEVILHALNYYQKNFRIDYQAIVLLQPTSPFRTSNQIKEAIALYTDDIDMVVSVVESNANPYYNLYEEDSNGFLAKSKNGAFIRRQDAPKIWRTNGSIYVINPDSIRKQQLLDFIKIIKYPMDEWSSIDLDSQSDWEIAEYVGKKNKCYQEQ